MIAGEFISIRSNRAVITISLSTRTRPVWSALFSFIRTFITSPVFTPIFFAVYALIAASFASFGAVPPLR